MGDGFYRSKDPTNSIKVLKEMLQTKENTNNAETTTTERLNPLNIGDTKTFSRCKTLNTAQISSHESRQD